MAEDQKKTKRGSRSGSTVLPKAYTEIVQDLKKLDDIDAFKKALAEREKELKAAEQEQTEKKLGKLVYRYRNEIIQGTVSEELIRLLKNTLSDGEVTEQQPSSNEAGKIQEN